MQSAATTVEQYLDEVPEDKSVAFKKLWAVTKKHIPKGFKSGVSYGMIGFVVPHTLYPKGYHCDPKLPLPFAGLAAQKNFIAFYHMGVYAKPDLYKWFVSEYPKHSKGKLDMGKSCIRFKKMDDIPYELMGELISKMTPEEWIATYEAAFLKNKK